MTRPCFCLLSIRAHDVETRCELFFLIFDPQLFSFQLRVVGVIGGSPQLELQEAEQ